MIALKNAATVARLYGTYKCGERLDEACRANFQYGSYTGVIFGLELASALFQQEQEPDTTYSPCACEHAVLLRPDRFVAAHRKPLDATPAELLERHLPLPA
ncbi:MAG: hypothetical protein QF921_09190 [Pseudomonadales bacterium]|jgi:hypothetical protein|nr:hypothetical protein [Pseudomonadales bacterium]MDP6472558.1 hypothetical protein [Pseudomonadales bacterium]MDP6829040.1 hypothetical protein [Pseudomonadales bacterium]MDP6971667.1 hypothetical protein [Pseudomonadales bacterium]|tara:strand:- start:271 stop:573 length:303 start_codon:yes stop_codon:yes gene_type:complete